MYNKVILVGNLTKAPELRYLQSNSAVCNTGIAVNRKFKSQSGELKEEVCFIDIALFGRTAEIANQYLKKGSKCLIDGRLKLDSWTDDNGVKKSRHSVVVESLKMLDNKPADQQSTANKPTPERKSPKETNHEPVIERYDIDDFDTSSIPF